jgi:hypothetical protein
LNDLNQTLPEFDSGNTPISHFDKAKVVTKSQDRKSSSKNKEALFNLTK